MATNLMKPPGSYTDSESDSEPDSNQFMIKPSALPAAGRMKPGLQSGLQTQPQELPSSSSDESGSDGPETEPESGSDGSDQKLSTMAAKSRDGHKKLNGCADKPGSKPETVKKRAADGKDPEAQRSKKKRGQFERLFSEEDEIALLNGMIRFAEKNKSAPFTDLDAFRDFVKPDLNVDPTKDQLKHKMRKFKTKYDKNMRKEASGSARSLKAHERRAFQLSKLAWANEFIKGQKLAKSPKAAKEKKKEKNAASVVKNGATMVSAKAKKKAAGVAAEILSLSDVSLGMTNIPRIGAQLFEGGRGVEGEEEWRELKKAEMEVYLKKVKLMCTQTKLVLDALIANNC